MAEFLEEQLTSLPLQIMRDPRNSIVSLLSLLVLEFFYPTFDFSFQQVYMGFLALLFLAVLVYALKYEKYASMRMKQESVAQEKVPYVGHLLFLPKRTQEEEKGMQMYRLVMVLSFLLIFLNFAVLVALAVKVIKLASLTIH